MAISLLTWRNLVCYYFTSQQSRMRTLLRKIPLEQFLKFIDIPKSISKLRAKSKNPVCMETLSEFMDFNTGKSDNQSVLSAANSLNLSFCRSKPSITNTNELEASLDRSDELSQKKYDNLVVIDQIFVEIHKRLNILLSVLLLQIKPDKTFSLEAEMKKFQAPKRFFLFRKLIIKKIMTLIIKFMSFRQYLPGQKNSMFQKGIKKIKLEYSQLNIDDKLNALYTKQTIGEWLDTRVLLVLEEIVSTNITFHRILDEGSRFDDRKKKILRSLHLELMKSLIVKDDGKGLGIPDDELDRGLFGSQFGGNVDNQSMTGSINLGGVENGETGGFNRPNMDTGVLREGVSSVESVFDVNELKNMESSSVFNLDFNAIGGLL